MLTVRKGGHVELERYYSAMEIDFDEKELLGKWSIHRAMSAGDQELLIFSDADTGMDVGYALVMCRGLYGYVLLKYFGILPWFRGKGLGIQLMRELNRRYADAQGILAEVSEFEDPDPDRLRKLHKFFSRFGYEEIPVDYTISGVKCNLLVKPLKGRADITAVAHRIVPDFYTRFMAPAAVWRMLAFK